MGHSRELRERKWLSKDVRRLPQLSGLLGSTLSGLAHTAAITPLKLSYGQIVSLHLRCSTSYACPDNLGMIVCDWSTVLALWSATCTLSHRYVAFLPTAGSFLPAVGLPCLQLCRGVFYIQLELFYLQLESASNKHLNGL